MLLARVLCLTITAVLASKDQYEELGRSLHLAGRGVQTKGGNRSGREHGPLRTVETVHGPVVGEMKVEVDQRQGEVVRWTEFKGIPYAAPPVGPRRFLPPGPPLNWSTPLHKADEDLTICPQLILGALYGRSDEDCLHLTVHVPDQDTKELLPVLFWIHGGGFMSGDGTPDSFGPQYLVVHGVIIVTINYRLGPLGYLSLGTEEVPGNMGQMDQVMALQWVQNNIEMFGGDKSSVTMFGESAGAAAATYHLFSPQAEGLMRRVIADSGLGGFMPSFHHYQEEQATKYGANGAILEGCLDWERRAECLREKSVFAIQNMEVPMELMSQPSIDKLHSPNPYLPENPVDLVRSGQYQTGVDLLFGFNEDEGILISQFFLQAPDLYNVLVNAWDFLGPFSLLQKHHTEITDEDIEIATEILEYYTDGGGLANLGPDNFWNITAMFSDSFFSYACYLFLEHHLKHSEANTFQYRFSYFGEYHRVGAPGLHHDNCPGVTHSDELYYFWNPFWEDEYPLNEKDSEMSLKLTTMWTNFAKTGDPNLGTDLGLTKWEAQTPEQKEYLRIGKDGDMSMELGSDYLERVQFWGDVMAKHNTSLCCP